ncbi:2-octaprenyl-6-methoxyphenyl hydroxylase [Vibrio sp. TH_r3]|uniref:2-octaprenyl-6-methoxyphenyl hydroxylase n=1 Tax=Vibrio sp. TH_r3 TaxID=3082084 RepID=UPI0029543483|nr:2-octaprenyl-6-methoxyphenyl hydroxylase [Vibrio sp. TH_r3]MDV7106266.1 2-octaprenyl-6-methoxyphenyl hydroxylase [Vibrio sp. TH_r3]
MKQYDIVIAGGAMVGSTLALALDHLSQQGLSIAVIEPYAVDNDAPHPGFDSRSIALSYGTKLILEKFQLWSVIEPFTTAIDHIHVSDRGQIGVTHIDKTEQCVPALGYVVELADVGSLYKQRIDNCKQIDYLCPDSVARIDRERDFTLVTLTSGQVLCCQILVAADGADSTCCNLLGHEQTEYDFEQVAIITNVEISEPHHGRAFERFTSSGPLAFLPMSNNRMSVVWCLKPEQVQKTLVFSDEEFIAELQTQFGWRLGKILRVGKKASYPLILKKKQQIVSHRFATVGNAAQLLHPIAGQGFNLGIRDVESLASKLVGQKDVGDFSLLSQYRKCREDDRDRTIELISTMVHIFSNDWFPLQLGRNVALMAMDNSRLFKSPLLGRTMGLVRK